MCNCRDGYGVSERAPDDVIAQTRCPGQRRAKALCHDSQPCRHNLR